MDLAIFLVMNSYELENNTKNIWVSSEIKLENGDFISNNMIDLKVHSFFDKLSIFLAFLLLVYITSIDTIL